MFKAGTVKELEQFKERIERDVYHTALHIVSMLDETYGADRDVDDGDGGFVLIAETIQDVSQIDQRYVRLDSGRHEIVDIVKYDNRAYLNALFLSNNEFGINIFIPMDIAPSVLLRNLSQKVK